MSRYTDYFKIIGEYGPCIHRGDEDLCDFISGILPFAQSRRELMMYHDLRVVNNQVGFRPKPDAKHRVGKVGRMLKQIIPDIDDYDLEKVSSAVNGEYLVDTSAWVYTEGNNFEEAFTGKFMKESYFDTTNDKKSQYNSCMRYDYVGKDGYPAHPATAYDTGDFKVATLYNEEGLMLARTVICTLTNTRAPIYCVSNKAYSVFVERLTAEGVTIAISRDWKGARFKNIDHTDDCHDYKVLPYIDLDHTKLMLNPADDMFYYYGGGYEVKDCTGTVNASGATGLAEFRRVIKKPSTEGTFQPSSNACSTVTVSTGYERDMAELRSAIQRYQELRGELMGEANATTT